MPEPETDQNRIVVDSLRETIDSLAKRLTPAVEPAVIYSAQMRSPDTATEETK
jgi:hypothetical protein